MATLGEMLLSRGTQSSEKSFGRLAEMAGKNDHELRTTVETPDFHYEYSRRIIVDSNVSRATAWYLKDAGFKVIENNADPESASCSDEDLLKRAFRSGSLLVTHDKDFLNSRRFNFARTVGVALMPTPSESNISCTPETFKPLKCALDHFSTTFCREICAWIYNKVIQYKPDGEALVFPIEPVRRNQNGEYPDYVQKMRYM